MDCPLRNDGGAMHWHHSRVAGRDNNRNVCGDWGAGGTELGGHFIWQLIIIIVTAGTVCDVDGYSKVVLLSHLGI